MCRRECQLYSYKFSNQFDGFVYDDFVANGFVNTGTIVVLIAKSYSSRQVLAEMICLLYVYVTSYHL